MRLLGVILITLTLLLPASAYTRVELDLSKLKLKDQDLLALKVISPAPGIAEVSWKTAQQNYSPKRSYPFYVKRSTQAKTYFLNLAAYVKAAKIDRLLFFGPDGSQIVSAKPIKGSALEKLLAAWQEFWGPQGRERAGDAFTIIHPSKLFNRSIFVYLNWLIGLLIVIALIRKQPKLALGAILGLWFLLELTCLPNNWASLKADLKFWGKSLEEKRAMQNYKDFYAFMQQAEKVIPPHASFVLITQPKYRFSMRRAKYYLYPRTWAETEPLYVLLYDKQPNKNILKTHKLISQFRPGAYILRQKSYRPETTHYAD